LLDKDAAAADADFHSSPAASRGALESSNTFEEYTVSMPTYGKIKFTTLAVVNFLAQYHHYLTAFVFSTVIASYVGEKDVGFVVAGASLMMALTMLSAPSIFTAFGTRNVLSFLGLAEIATLLGFAIAQSPVWVITLFVLQGVFTYALFIGIDLLIEARTPRESATGNARGAMLTVTNIAVIASTYSLSFILAGDEYFRVFVASALVLVPFLALTLTSLPPISYVGPPKAALPSTTLATIRKSRTMKAIVGSHFLLQVFFSWMVIYSPILLHDYIHFSWVQIGIMLSIAMIPYVVLEYPLGYIADTWLGEKEILILGFIILSASTLVMSFIDGVSFFAWVAIMVVSRIGAAMVEVMTETHFFKQVSIQDTGAITVFRILRPLGSIAAPIAASIALSVLSLPLTFAVFGIILALGIPLAFTVVDSK
jgi:MFS family permease